MRAPDDSSPTRRIVAHHIVLPVPPAPRGAYLPAVVDGRHLRLSAHGPMSAESATGFSHIGRVGAEIGVEDARAAARVAALNLLASAEAAVGSLDHVDRIVSVTGYVNATPDFEDHAAVLDGASELLLDVFGPSGAHTRTVVGVAGLPFGLPLVIELVATLTPQHGRLLLEHA